MVVVSGLDGGRKVMSLRRGHCGLRRDIPQAEGIASDDRDTLWIVSEPNLFYRFTRINFRQACILKACIRNIS
ncbi:hypothetical protein CJZ73_23850 [Salmonella enterica subsp. enterica serovar Enteritidis]|nr:hypothetical protein CJZ73_23850 [Salmonella enterica subsp. enterica serovar Enteritidis]